MADVFVSYSRRDKARVAPLVAAIESRGWSVWWDPAIVPGQEFDREIDTELKQAAAVLAVWTPDSVDSRWVRGEARDAADRGVLVPVRFDGAKLPIDVRAFHTIDLDDAVRDARSPQVQELLGALGALVAKQHAGQPASASATPAPAPVPRHSRDRVSICVLPFSNIGGDPRQAAFSDGITEDIITELSRWRLLAVSSRASAFRYQDMAVDVRRVARDLDVAFVVEGSVRRMGDRIRITAQLIDAETGNHVWAEKFDRGAADLFSVQDEVVRTIVSTLVGRMQVSDIERSRRGPPASLAAYQCVLQGNALPWDEPQGAAEATRLFEKAIELDPGYGMAYSLLAAMRYGLWRDGSIADATLDEAYALAKRGVELDSNESTCFSILAQVCLMQRSFDLALQYERRAVEMNPTNQWNTADMGLVLGYLGQPEEALEWFRRAREIDPYFDPPWYFRSIGQALMALHRYAEALVVFDRIAPLPYRVAALVAACHARLGNAAEAAKHAASVLEKKPDFTISRFMARQPFKEPADAAHLAESLRMAGLPE